jgi:hypothetical protein
MGPPNNVRRTRIERLLAELNAQTTELHRLAIVTQAPDPAPRRRQKRAGKKPAGKKR